MNSRRIITLCILVFMCVVPVTISIHAEPHSILYVGGSGSGNYTTLQDAINASNPGDTIVVLPGSYGTATIEKPLSIVGQQAVTEELFIRASNVTVDGLIIRSCYHAITIEGDDNIIRNCIITNNTYGITIEGNKNDILDNKIFKNFYYGIWVDYASGNEINGNEMYWNSYGIFLQQSDSNVILFNLVRNNGVNLKIQGSMDNIVKRNTLKEAEEKGIYFCCESRHNIVYENNFINNTQNAYAFDELNYWDYEGKGNFWTDHNGTGSYVIYGENIDYYPVTVQYTFSEQVYHIFILTPELNSTISNIVLVQGLAEKEGAVEISIDNGSWVRADGTFAWRFEFDTADYENGLHTLSVRCGSANATTTFHIDNKEKGTPSFEVPLVLCALCVISLVVAKKRRYSNN